MNILLTNSTDIFAGGEDYVLILAKYLALRGHHVTVSAQPGHLLLRKCEQAGIAVAPLRYTGMGRVFAVAGEMRAMIRERNIGVVHSNANYDRTCAALATAFSSVVHVAGVHSAHSIQHNITHLIRNRWGTQHFIADAEAVKKVMVKEDGIPDSRITVISIGVEGDSEEHRSLARVRTRTSLGIEPGTIVVGNVARLVPFKGHTHLLQAIAEVVQHRQDVLFFVVGDGELQGVLAGQTKELGIEQHVRWLGFRDDLDDLYPAFDVYCHSSLELAAEAFPIAILRALAAGLPVVSTNVGGIRLMVEEGRSGFLTPPGDPGALALALLKIIADPALGRSMGKASHALFLRDFDAGSMAARVQEVYRMALRAQSEPFPATR